MQLENYSTKYQVQIQQYELTETQLQFTDYPSNNIQQASDSPGIHTKHKP